MRGDRFLVLSVADDADNCEAAAVNVVKQITPKRRLLLAIRAIGRKVEKQTVSPVVVVLQVVWTAV
jgi:hypothetical protein